MSVYQFTHACIRTLVVVVLMWCMHALCRGLLYFALRFLLFFSSLFFFSKGYPKLGVEIGGGMAAAYNHRVHMFSEDMPSMHMVLLANNFNMLGFYMSVLLQEVKLPMHMPMPMLIPYRSQLFLRPVFL